MTERRPFELKVGLFVFAGLGLLFFIVFSLGEYDIFRPGYTLRVMFEETQGLDLGAPVRVAGVQVGKVESIELLQGTADQPARVELGVWLPQSVRVEEDAQVTIGALGLLGEKYLAIAPGHGRALKHHETLMGIGGVNADELIQRSGTVLRRLDTTLASMEEVLADAETREALKTTILETRELATQWRMSMERLNSILTQLEAGQGSLGHLLMDDTLYLNVLALVQDLRAHPWKLLRRGKETPALTGSAQNKGLLFTQPASR